MAEKTVVPVILGPTAVGKTELALELAQNSGYEIISCDSRQIYRFMDVGTAKPSLEQRSAVKHHLIDILEPSQTYSAFAFARDALRIIRESARNKKKVLICGGTGLYFYILSGGGPADLDETDLEYRALLQKQAEENGAAALHDKLREVDPQAASRIHSNDLQRLLRALSIFHRSGRSISSLQKTKSPPRDIEFRTVVVNRPREILYERINRRVDIMIERGLWEEFRSLRDRGYGETSPGMVCVGYRELFDVERGASSLNSAAALIKQNSRRYAKRQMTWFRNKTEAARVEVSDGDCSQFYRWFHG